MNHIEDGIANNSSGLTSLSDIPSKVSNIESRISTIQSQSSQAAANASNAVSAVNDMKDKLTDAGYAFSQIEDAVSQYKITTGDVSIADLAGVINSFYGKVFSDTPNINTRLASIELNIADILNSQTDASGNSKYLTLAAWGQDLQKLANSAIGTAQQALTNFQTAKGNYGSLIYRLKGTDNRIATLDGRNVTGKLSEDGLSDDPIDDPATYSKKNNLAAHVQALEKVLNYGKDLNYETVLGGTNAVIEGDTSVTTASLIELLAATLDDRLGAIDSNAAPSRTIQSLITEIGNAHISDTDTLAARFNRIDSTTAGDNSIANRLADLETEIDNANGDGTLSQRFTGIDTRISAIDGTAVGANTIANRLAATEKEIADAHRAGLTDSEGAPVEDTLDKRFDDLDKVTSDIQDELTGVHSEVTEAHRTDEDTLDKRFDDAESRLDSAESRLSAIDNAESGELKSIKDNINYIAEELNMLDDAGALKNTQTKVDTLEAHVETMATELGMLQSGEIIDTNSRLDNFESTVSNKFDAIDQSITGLTTADSTINGRIDTIAADLNTEETGLQALRLPTSVT